MPETLLDTLKILCAQNGVSGTEDEVRDYIAGRVRPFADEVKTDLMGNLLVFKKGGKTPAKKVMLCAHMDEVGVIVTDITDDGYLKFACVGGVDRRVLIGKTVFLGTDRVRGVIGHRAVHLVRKEEKENVPQTEELYIDIGAGSKEEALGLTGPGETGAFDGTVYEFGEGFLKAKAIDDRIGCAVLITLIESELPVDCHFAFTVQEEVGTRGVFGAAFKTAPDVALAVEGTAAADLPSVEATKKITVPGRGVVIPFMDGGTIYNRELYRFLTGLAEQNGIPWQTKTVIAGSTDAAAVQRSRAGVQTAGIAAPIRNLHSPACVGKSSDFNDLYELARLFLSEMGE